MVSSIDNLDASHDKMHLILFRALGGYSERDLLDLLVEESVVLRTTAARRLHLIGGKETFGNATQLLKAERFENREIGAFVLGQLGTPEYPYATESLGPLSSQLNDAYYEVRATTLTAIAFLSGKTTIPNWLFRAVAKTVTDMAPEVREAAAFTLGLLDFAEAKPLLEGMCLDSDPAVAEEAAAALENKR